MEQNKIVDLKVFLNELRSYDCDQISDYLRMGFIGGLDIAENIAENIAIKIATLALVAEGKTSDIWNTDFEEAPQDYDTPILIKYYCNWKKCERITVGHYEEVLGEPDYTGFHTWYDTGCMGESKVIKNLISWKLITPLSNEE